MLLFTLILLSAPASNPTQLPSVQVEVVDEEEDFDLIIVENDDDEINQN